MTTEPAPYIPMSPKARRQVAMVQARHAAEAAAAATSRSAHTPLRSVRVPDALWQAAKAKADAEGVTLSDVVRRALEQYAG